MEELMKRIPDPQINLLNLVSFIIYQELPVIGKPYKVANCLKTLFHYASVRLNVPQYEGLIIRTRNYMCPIRGESYGVNPSFVLESSKFIFSLYFPNPNCLIFRSRNDQSLIWRESQCKYASFMFPNYFDNRV